MTFLCTNNVTVTTSDSVCDMTGFGGKFGFAARDNGDSTTTVYANFIHTGLAVILK